MDHQKFDLNFVQSDINLKKVKPIEKKQLAKVVNEYLLRMCDILNAFATKIESRVFLLEDRLDLVETKLILLEKKLENVNLDASENTFAQQPSTSTTVPPNTATSLETVKNEEPMTRTTNEDTVSAEPVSEMGIKKDKDDKDSDFVAAQDHPHYAKYFKMLKIGISEAAVQQKMIMDGADATILNRPHEKLAKVQSETSEDDFSNENSSNDGFSSS